MGDAAKPALQRHLEAIASVMGLGHGRERLELIFSDGELEVYYLHHEKRRPGELAEYDDEARWLAAPGQAD